MNILFLIGNGFDINLGLKTRYENFYKNAYLAKESDNDLIRKLKENIKEGIKDWADLEFRLGEYTAELNDQTEFDIIFDDIRQQLSEYIALQEASISQNDAIRNIIINDLVYPYKFLELGEIRNFKSFMERMPKDTVSINSIVYNYTQSFEKVIGYSNAEMPILDGKASIKTIEHIHGYTNARFILGVDNIMQIKNESFRNNANIRTSLIKPVCNSESQLLIDEKCRELINASNIICIFGMSLGETDKTWWDYISRTLINKGGSQLLIIFWKGEYLSSIFPDKIVIKKRDIKNKFISHNTSLTNDQRESIKNNYIFVSYNSKIFDLSSLIHIKK